MVKPIVVSARTAVLLTAAAFAVGLALLSLPFLQARHDEDWAARLRQTGVPLQLTVSALEQYERGRSSPSRTMFFRYEFDGRPIEAEMPCVRVCLVSGTPVAVWVNPADPTDFVAEFGQLSGHRSWVVGPVGFVGAMMVIFSSIIGATRWKQWRSRVRAEVARTRLRATRPRLALGTRPAGSRARFRRK
ncbi:DUF3592 domain-containing protein [Catellatospora tritici]|uniref:DUF3592 domain-containing protein n=1 Tax=Catellatospora tritici TaxID=2851566 RepID=UPI001C2D4236|nr:DUF3592 domain-containing protein [Catellatospora tritici]MBV1850579.1 DUF3592 domain-containing protein [Catellatospora tritici]